METPDKDGKQVHSNFHFGVTYREGQDVPPVNVQLQYYPAAAVYDAHRSVWATEFDGALMRMTRGELTIEIDETTGQVRRFELRDEEAGTEFILGAAPDRLAAEISRLDRRLATATNAWRVDAAVTSLAQFSLDEYAHFADLIGRPLPATKLALVQQLVPRVCRRADQWLATVLSDSKPESFSFPPPENENKGWQLLSRKPMLAWPC
jgi:hypothetical protein